jgi:hypothetical protein
MRRKIAFALYLPVVAALGLTTLFCLFLLVKGQVKGGAYSLPYGFAALLLGWRAFRIHREEIEEAGLWKDILLLGLACVLLAVLLLSALA